MSKTVTPYTHSTEVLVNSPSWRRLRNLLTRLDEFSLLRSLEYEILATCGLSGRILDVGGGERVGYSELIALWVGDEKEYVYESVNIDASAKPTFLIDIGELIPVDSETYDTVITLNTLEHIYDLRSTVAEVFRVLKTNGKLIFTVPFMFRVHGYPDDFFRGTPSFWQTFLRQQGFREVRIEAMTWGPFSTGLIMSGSPGPLKKLRRNLALAMDVFYFNLRYGSEPPSAWKQDQPVCSAALGFFIWAYK